MAWGLETNIKGPGGPVGPQGSNAFTLSAASFTVPPVNSTVAVAVLDAAWVTVGQMIWVENAGGPGIAGAFLVTAKAGNTLTLLNPPSSTGGGGGGISPPPSDGGEYIFVNGDWRLKSQSFLMTGATTQVVPVPAGARMVRMVGSAYPLVGNGVTMHVATSGTTMITTGYFWGGFAVNTGTDGFVAYAETSGSSAMFVTGTANITDRPHTFIAEMNLVRPDTTKTFSMMAHGQCHSNLANRLLRQTHFNGWLDPAVNSALSLTAFEIVSGSTFGTGSYLEVNWIY